MSDRDLCSICSHARYNHRDEWPSFPSGNCQTCGWLGDFQYHRFRDAVLSYSDGGRIGSGRNEMREEEMITISDVQQHGRGTRSCVANDTRAGAKYVVTVSPAVQMCSCYEVKPCVHIAAALREEVSEHGA